MKKVLHYLNDNFEEIIMVALLVVITCCIFLNVIMRYVFKNALSWPEELSRYCYVYSGMLSAGYCLRKNVSFRVDLLYQKFPRSLKIAIEYLGKIIVLFLYAFMVYASFDLIATTTTVSTAMQIPMKYIYCSIPLGMSLGVLRGIQDLVLYTGKVIRGDDNVVGKGFGE